MSHDLTYLDLVNRVLSEGRVKKNRTGIDTIGIFGAQARFDLSDGFPLLTTKRVFFKGIVHELLWFISGSTNIKYLVDNDVHIWDAWAYQRYLKTPEVDHKKMTETDFIKKIKDSQGFAEIWGDLGMGTYGSMWRAFPFFNDYETVAPAEGREALDTVDQLKKVIDKLRTNPDDRRMIVSAWHPYWVDHCALPPCHVLFQFNTEVMTLDERYTAARTMKKPVSRCGPEERDQIQKLNHEELDRAGVPRRIVNCLMFQRSVDVGLGYPFNIASYSLLLVLVARHVGMWPGSLITYLGDVHIYVNHVDAIKEQLNRDPYQSPNLWVNPEKVDMFHMTADDIKIVDYQHHPAIRMEVAV